MRNYIDRLKALLAVPTVTYDEMQLVGFISTLLAEKDIKHKIDDMGNIIAVKGVADHYPCLVAHTDTVHAIDGKIDIREVLRPDYAGVMGPALTGYQLGTDTPSGCGGDDKSGVFICLELFDRLDAAMMFFPVSEETGCHGSKGARAEWFDKVGYFIQFDSPHGNTMSKSLRGVDIYQEAGEFYGLIGEQLEHIDAKRHPYTDVATLGSRFGVECLNLPAGYYNYHCPDEYVMLSDVDNAIDLGESIIDVLGVRRYEYLKPPVQSPLGPLKWNYKSTLKHLES
jgi:putative aminopeptidase FrvX